MDATDIDREEFSTLRAEIQFHQANASAIFALYLTGLGLGVTASVNTPIVLPIVAILSSVLGVRYCDHVVSTFRIAAYITCHLRPRLIERLGPDVLVWEGYLRGKRGDERCLPATLPTDSRRGFAVPGAAFFVPPPLLLAYAFTKKVDGRFELDLTMTPIAVVLATAVAAVTYAALRAIRSGKYLAHIDTIIAGSFEDDHPTPAP